MLKRTWPLVILLASLIATFPAAVWPLAPPQRGQPQCPQQPQQQPNPQQHPAITEWLSRSDKLSEEIVCFQDEGETFFQN
jgi:hypothetical protein